MTLNNKKKNNNEISKKKKLVFSLSMRKQNFVAIIKICWASEGSCK